MRILYKAIIAISIIRSLLLGYAFLVVDDSDCVTGANTSMQGLVIQGATVCNTTSVLTKLLSTPVENSHTLSENYSIQQNVLSYDSINSLGPEYIGYTHLKIKTFYDGCGTRHDLQLHVNTNKVLLTLHKKPNRKGLCNEMLIYHETDYLVAPGYRVITDKPRPNSINNGVYGTDISITSNAQYEPNFRDKIFSIHHSFKIPVLVYLLGLLYLLARDIIYSAKKTQD